MRRVASPKEQMLVIGVRWLIGPWGVESTLGRRVQGGEPQSESHEHNPRRYVLASYRF